MHIEQETVDFVASIIAEKYPNFGKRRLGGIAKYAILSDKVGDEKWLDDRITSIREARTRYRKSLRARKKAEGCVEAFDPEFKIIPTDHMAIFRRVYGEEAVNFLKRNLRDLSKAGHGWISQFYMTAKKIGLEYVDGNPDAYRIVTSHEYWEECRDEARTVYRKYKEIH